MRNGIGCRTTFDMGTGSNMGAQKNTFTYNMTGWVEYNKVENGDE